jgi:hypothetical protein
LLLAAAQRPRLECERDDGLANVIVVVVRRGRDPTAGGDPNPAVIRREVITATNMTVFRFFDGMAC